MIEARATDSAAAFVARLAAGAERLARARALTRLLARRGRHARRWSHPGLLWPLFGPEGS